MTSEKSVTRSQRIYRSLLLLYPRAFRQVYGADMMQVFGDRLREERAASGGRGSASVWWRTLLDLFRSAPLQRMEKPMSREAAFAILVALFVVFAVVAFTMGSEGPGLTVASGVLIAAGIALGVSGHLRRSSAAGNVPAGRPGLREWWVGLAALSWELSS